MFHVERRFSEEIVRGWELFHVEPSCVTCFAIFTRVSPYRLSCEMCAAVFHVERSFPKLEVRVQNLAYAAKQLAGRVRMGMGSVFRRNYRKSYLDRKQVGCRVPRGTKSQNRSRRIAGGKSLVLSSRWVDDDWRILCSHEEEPPK